ncbi:MAG: hypothetical protein V7721_00655 [Porticoccaceae bacterium]
MTTKTLSIVAVGFSLVIISGWAVYWGVQVQDVLELLELSRAE